MFKIHIEQKSSRKKYFQYYVHIFKLGIGSLFNAVVRGLMLATSSWYLSVILFLEKKQFWQNVSGKRGTCQEYFFKFFY